MNQHVRVDDKPIPFIDIPAQRRRLGSAIDDAVGRVLAHCQFIQGPEVRALEADLAAFCGAKHVIGCASGTDALLLVLLAWEIGPGDAVICPAFTFHATAEQVALLGATPVFADVEADTFNIDPASLERAVATAKARGLKPRAVIPVDLFGLPADHDAIASIAERHGLLVLDDAAQSFGALYRGRKLGKLATATATSFFPAKPLGCYGDGGAVFTDDDELAARVKSLRVHGESPTDKYDAQRIGVTGRLDTIQAAVLIEKLKIFPEEIAARQAVAAALRGRPRRRRDHPAHRQRIDLGLGAIHHPPRGWAPRRIWRGVESRRHSDRDLLRQAAAPPGGIPRFSDCGWRPSGLRSACGRGHQPADARLSGGAGARPRHCSGSAGAHTLTQLA